MTFFKPKKQRDQRTLGPNDRKYLALIDELQKNVRLDSPTAEISRMYKEVIDILTEAFDEYEASDLPKYKARLEYIIELSKNEAALNDPLFKEDLDKASNALQSKIDERWGFYQKLKRVGSITARSVGGLTTVGQELLDIADRGYNIGSQFGGFGGSSASRLDGEERRRMHDALNGNQGQYGTSSSSTSLQTLSNALTTSSLIPVKDDKSIAINEAQNKILNSLFVVTKDSNKDIKDIKKYLLAQEIRKDDQLDDTTLQELEDRLEKSETLLVRNKSSPLKDLAASGVPSPGSSMTNTSGSSPKSDDNSGSILGSIGEFVAEGYIAKKLFGGAKKALPWLKRSIPWIRNVALPASTLAAEGALAGGATAAAEGALAGGATAAAEGALAGGATAVAGGAGLTTAAAIGVPLAAGAVGGAAAYGVYKGTPSLASTIGEKTKGIEYYKQLFGNQAPGDEGTQIAEQYALEYLQEEAKAKKSLYKESYKNKALYGNGEYKINGKPATVHQAAQDLEDAIDIYEKYKKYLEEKKKAGKSMGMAVFTGSDGQLYTNPLFKPEELLSSLKEYKEKLKVGVNQSDDDVSDFWSFGDDDDAHEHFHEQRRLIDDFQKENIDPLEKLIREKAKNVNAQVDTTPVEPRLPNDEQEEVNVKAAPLIEPKKLSSTRSSRPLISDVDTFMRLIAAAETGPVTEDKPIDSPKRFIRTKGGANSSAYGPHQITLTLARDGLEDGLFDDDPDLKEWVVDKFIPQAKTFLRSDYSDPQYGSGGSGDLNTEEDRKMYFRMASALINDASKRNSGKLLPTLGEWRLGSRKKGQLTSTDPDYIRRVSEQIKRDEALRSPSDVDLQPISHEPIQNAVGDLSRRNEEVRSQPIIIAAPQSPEKQLVGGSGFSTKEVGAPSNGAAESTFLWALRHVLSPLS